LVVATADPGTLPGKATWYLVTNLPRPVARARPAAAPGCGLAETVRIYGIRNWTGQSYMQITDELGWADFQVRSGTAIRRHQVLVNCAFSFCWDAWFADTRQAAACTSASQVNKPSLVRNPPFRRCTRSLAREPAATTSSVTHSCPRFGCAASRCRARRSTLPRIAGSRWWLAFGSLG
jgi:hypothetical protein